MLATPCWGRLTVRQVDSLETVTGEWMRRVLLVEDQRFVRVLVGDVLRQAGFEVSAHPDAASALEVVETFDPDVLLTDIELGSRPDGVDLAVILRSGRPQLGVMFLTNYPQAASAPRHEAITGALFVSKDSLGDPEQLVDYVDAATRAESRPTGAAPSGELAVLSRAQLELLSLMSEGLSNDEIARRTSRTSRAVERMVSRTFDRLSISNRSEMNARVAAVNLYTRVFGHPGSSASL